MGHNVIVIVIEGTGYERGVRHGIEARERIAVQWPKWFGDLERTGLGAARNVIADFLAATDFATDLITHAPHLHDEIRGIADGAKLPFDEVFAFNCMDEMWCFIDRQSAPGPMDAFRGCSVIGVRQPSTGPRLLGQNMDLGLSTVGGAEVLAIKPSGATPGQLFVTHVGMIGLAGVNHHGIGVCVNTLMGLANRPTGLPVAAITRLIVEQATLAEAVSCVQSVPHADGQAYTIGSPEGIRCFEGSAHGVAEYFGDDDVVLHTNHALVSEDLNDQYTTTPSGESSSANRLAFLASQRPADRPECEAALSDQSVPLWFTAANSGDAAVTFASYIYELTSEPVMHLRVGESVEMLRVPTPR